MSAETLAIARSYSEATNNKDWERLRTILAPDVTATSHSASHVSHGPEEIIAALQHTTGAVANTRIEVMNAFADGDQAVLELRMTGTTHGDPNTDPDAGDPDKGEERVVSLPTCHVYRVRDGQIVSITTYSDRRWR
jgi:steroid delta-isomerase-like uncharacterized protein